MHYVCVIILLYIIIYEKYTRWYKRVALEVGSELYNNYQHKPRMLQY